MNAGRGQHRQFWSCSFKSSCFSWWCLFPTLPAACPPRPQPPKEPPLLLGLGKKPFFWTYRKSRSWDHNLTFKIEAGLSFEPEEKQGELATSGGSGGVSKYRPVTGLPSADAGALKARPLGDPATDGDSRPANRTVFGEPHLNKVDSCRRIEIIFSFTVL